MAYWHRRYEELAGTRPLPPGVPEAKPPLIWESYSALLNTFQRSLEFQRAVTRWLQQAEGSRQWLPGMKQPLVTDNTGLQLEGRANPVYVDQLAVDQATLGPGLRPSVHSFSNKQRNFAGMSENEALRQLELDAREARAKYGGEVEVRRRGHPLFGQKVRISRVHLVYDGKGFPPNSRRTSWKPHPDMVSNFTSMSPDEWNKYDSFHLELFSHVRPLDQGFEALEPLLEVIESLSDELRPDQIHHTRRVPEVLATVRCSSASTSHYIDTNTVIRLVRSQPA